MSAAERARQSRAVCERIMALPEMATAERVMVFIAMPGEIETRPIVKACLAAGKKVYAPKSLVRPRRLIACRLRSMGELRPGAFGILEPSGEEICGPANLDFILVPAMGFDRRGNRLGKGAGYYDRFMASPGFRATRAGVVFECQIAGEIPVEPHDLPVSIIVTADEIIRTG